MANIFGIDIETPQEQQERMLRERLAGAKNFAGNEHAMFGYNLANALSAAFGGGKAERKESEDRMAAQQAGQLVQDQLVKQGMDPVDAEIRARAHTIAVLRDKGDMELANQIQQSTTELLNQRKRESADMGRIKAQTEQAEQATHLSKTEGQITAELSKVNEKLGAFPDGQRGGEVYNNLRRRQEVLSSRVLELREKQDKAKNYTLTDKPIVKDGKTYIQRVAVNSNDPTEVITIGDPVEELGRMSSSAEKAMMDHQRAYLTANGRLAEINSLLDGLGELDDAGTLAEMNERAKALTGTQDAESYVRTRLQSLRVSDAIQNLPPGVASDKDIELVMSGTIPPNASPEVLRMALEAMQRVEQASAGYNKYAAGYMSENGNSRGLLPAYEEQAKLESERMEAQRLADVENRQKAQQVQQQATNRAAEIVGQIEQMQTAMSNPQFPPQARAQYEQQLQKLAQELATLQQAASAPVGGGQSSNATSDDDVLTDILRR